jgi:membrane-associated phospholipid phosphatase
VKKFIIALFLVNVFCFNIHPETWVLEDNDYSPPSPPIRLVFHNIGRNLFDAVTYNYGINFIGAGLGTWAFIETGLDWKWRNIAKNTVGLPNFGLPGSYLGYIVPGLTPLVTYAAGRLIRNTKLQIASFALAQALLLTMAVQTPLKMITGRALPGIVDKLDHSKSRRTDDFSGEFNWFNSNFIGGWPSGHTANAFAAAAVISEIYKDNLWLKIGVWTYAGLIGLGVTSDIHWASDALAGALIGYAIGKTVGKSFSKVLGNSVSDCKASFYFTTEAAGVVIRF